MNHPEAIILLTFRLKHTCDSDLALMDAQLITALKEQLERVEKCIQKSEVVWRSVNSGVDPLHEVIDSLTPAHKQRVCELVEKLYDEERVRAASHAA